MRGNSQQATELSFASRIIRGRRLDRNPLRRLSDRVETVVAVVLMTAFLVGAPLAALVAGGWVHRAAQRAEVTQQADRRQVDATLLASPAVRSADQSSMVSWADTARWVAPDGRTVSVSLPIAVAVRALPASMPVWSSRDGELVPPPLNGLRVTWLTVLAAVSGLIATALTLLLAGLTARLLLNRHRMTAWDVDWLFTEPRWNTYT